MYVIKYTGTDGKSEHNNGEFYSSTGNNGLWNYHRWTDIDQAKKFKTKEEATKFKTYYAKTISPLKGRIVKA